MEPIPIWMAVCRWILLYSKRFFIGVLLLLAFWPLGQKAVFADDRFIFTDNMDFGKLVAASRLGPIFYSIVLSKEELENPAEPYKGLLRLSGGKVGKIRYIPGTEHEYIISINYPNNYYLDDEKKVGIRHMDRYSTTEVLKEDAMPFFDIEFGGELYVDSGYRGTVQGSVPIIINIGYE